jgi:hypothetical protein
MMFPYALSFKPPMPALDVDILHPLTNARATLFAKIDTAADQTIIPESIVNILDLEPQGLTIAQPVDSDVRVYITYACDLIVAGRQFIDLEAAAAPVDYILLGRDVLNELRITLDGPQLRFVIH